MTDKPDPRVDALLRAAQRELHWSMAEGEAAVLIAALDALPVEVTNTMRRAGCAAIDPSTIYEDHDVSRADECYRAMEAARRKR